MKKLGLIITASIICSTSFLFAQTIDSENKQSGVFESPDAIRKPIDRTWEKDILRDNTPIPLQPIDEEYIHYAALIWRVIDLREKMNLPLYFPTETKGNWKSFARIIWEAVDSTENNPMPIRIYSTEYFDIPLSNAEFRGKFSIEPRIQPIWLTDEEGNQVFDEETGEPISIGDTTIMQFADPKDIMQYDIKEEYFVDNQRSMLDVRIMGICPILQKGGTDLLGDEEEAPPAEETPPTEETPPAEDEFADEFAEDEYTEGELTEETPEPEPQVEEELPEVSGRKLAPIGWLYYPEFRPVMAKNEVFNTHNNANRRTYDDIFLQRHFSSFIRAEENVYDNREIFFYIVNGLDQILEAEKIKHKIFEYEHNMWEY
ncbi:MAG: hypothetical protein BWY27_00433 [Bacteroidetes bacterium ADurb.Bin234]|jgi:gliding motility associated protien GldN|nr:MAG: hypothetical protein BWY27_00433 [Bacteroidetes bacterium ADurb.Bin234]